MENKILIFTLDRGFVLVGKAEIDPDLAFHWKLSPCRTIRVWGTTEGLAELQDGPTKDTVLDKVCTERVPFRSVIKIMEVDDKKWKKHLST